MAKIDVGAVQSRTRFGDKASAYWQHHLSSFGGSLRRLLQTPAQTLMTALVVAIALSLPATLLVSLSNIQQLGDSWDASPKVSVYLHLRARPAAIEQLISKLERLPEVASVQYLSAEQVLTDFQRLSGFGQALGGLDDNPLPATLVIAPTSNAAEPSVLQQLGETIAAEPIVDEVSLDMEWVRRLREFMVLGKKIVAALAGLLGLGVLLAIGNTIRLAIENRRDEIIVSKLVGGTNGFVRRPFIYCGGWYGFMGGLLASLIVSGGFSIIDDTVTQLASLYQSDFTLQSLGVTGSLQLVGLGTLLGWLGAWLAVGRHLVKIEPK
ncbi:permease-like cell division protein FtsX [Teredinibacter purpureus]|uniref:permease-like cell division protein FtsX n=1 Tax=Teredinibacter purpureus TaxID=2731756 RepID=UPI0005F858B5|nr:permease-like cell division protein FtsX [Teredinibacter purpureus]